MKRKAPSYLRQLAQPMTAGEAVLSVPRRARGRTDAGEKFGLAGVPVIQQAEEAAQSEGVTRRPGALFAEKPAAGWVKRAEVGASERKFERAVEVGASAKKVKTLVTAESVSGRAAVSRRAAAGEALRAVALGLEAGTPLRSVVEMRGEGLRRPVARVDAVERVEAVEKRDAERQVDAPKAAAVVREREVVRLEVEKAAKVDAQRQEARVAAAAQPKTDASERAAGQRARVHIGTLEVRVRSSQPVAAPAPVQQKAVESVPAGRLAPPAVAQPLARGLAWQYGLVQG